MAGMARNAHQSLGSPTSGVIPQHLSMKPRLLGIALLFSFVCAAQAADPELRAGDCWSYASRPGEGESYLVIRKIETYPGQGTVVHISVFDLKLKLGETVVDRLPHLILGAESLRASLREKVTRTPPETDWQKPYQTWYQRYGSKGKLAVSHIPLRQLLRELEMMNESRR